MMTMRINSPSRPRKLLPPPNYAARAMQWRIMSWLFVGYLVLQIGSIILFPEEWKWIYGSNTVEETQRREASIDPTQEFVEPEPIKVLDLTDSPESPATERAWRLGWGESWAELSHDDRSALLELLELATEKKPVPAERQEAITKAVQQLGQEWSGYRERAERSIQRIPQGERAAWFPVLEQLDFQWQQVTQPVLDAAAKGETLDDEQRRVCQQTLTLLDQQLWDSVEDNTMWRPAEREIWHRAVLRVKTVAAEPSDTRPKSPLVDYISLNDDPQKFRGRLVRVRGTAQAVYSRPAGPNPDGIEKYWIYVLWPYGGTNSPLMVYALEKPEKMPFIRSEDVGKKPMPTQEEVTFEGVFFKRLAYPSQGGFDAAPLVVAVRPQWTPSKVNIPKPVPYSILATVAAGLGAITTTMAIMIYRMYPPGKPFRDSTTSILSMLVAGMLFSIPANAAQPPSVNDEVDIEQHFPVAVQNDTSDEEAEDEEPAANEKALQVEERPNPTDGPLPWERGAKPLTGGDIRYLPPREYFDLLGFDASHWRNFYADSPLGPNDTSPIARLMYLADRFNTPLLDAWRARGATWEKLLADPPSQQAEVLRLRGTATKIERVEVLPELQRRFDLKYYYRVDFVDDGHPSAPPHCILFVRDVPAELFDGKKDVVDLSEPIGVDGIFVKRVKPEDVKLEDREPSFVFVSRRLGWYPNTTSTRLDEPKSQGLLAQNGFDIGLLESIRERNGRPLDDGDGDLDAFYGMMAAANKASESKALPPASPLQLETALTQPKALAGRFVKLKGIARRVTEIGDLSPAVQNWLGTDHYYEIDMFVGVDKPVSIKQSSGDETPLKFGYEYPITICTTRLPAELKPSEKILEHIAVEGFFYRLWAYDSDYATGAHRKQLSPLIFATSTSKVITSTPRESSGGILAAIVTCAGILGFAIWYWRAQQKDLAHGRKLRGVGGDKSFQFDPGAIEREAEKATGD
jgi:hypothetical protein